MRLGVVGLLPRDFRTLQSHIFRPSKTSDSPAEPFTFPQNSAKKSQPPTRTGAAHSLPNTTSTSPNSPSHIPNASLIPIQKSAPQSSAKSKKAQKSPRAYLHKPISCARAAATPPEAGRPIAKTTRQKHGIASSKP